MAKTVTKTKKPVKKKPADAAKTPRAHRAGARENPSTTPKPAVAATTLHAAVYGPDGKAKGTITLPKELFAAKVNQVLLAQAVRVYLANQRKGNASTKTRGEVEGSTRKIYRQKGTGRARHGAIRAPIFVGGGIVFGPRPRDFRLHLPQKMRRAALSSALTASLRDGKVRVVDGLEKLQPKTKYMAESLKKIGCANPTLLVIGPGGETAVRSARNLAGVDVLPAASIHPHTLLSHKSLLFTKSSIEVLVSTFVKKP